MTRGQRWNARGSAAVVDALPDAGPPDPANEPPSPREIAASPDPSQEREDDPLAAFLDDEGWDESPGGLAADLGGEPEADKPDKGRPLGPDPSLDDLLAIPEAPAPVEGWEVEGWAVEDPDPAMETPGPWEPLEFDDLPGPRAARAAPGDAAGPSRSAVVLRPREVPTPSPEVLASLALVPASRSVLAEFERLPPPGRRQERQLERPPSRPADRALDRPADRAVDRPVGRAVGRAGIDELDRLLKVGAARPSPARRWLKPLVWLAILGGLLWVAFLPYPFEVGGEFVVQPLDRAEARSRTDGEITEVNVAEGDWVEAGDVMAVLSNWDELRDVALNEADGAKLRADLATLTAGATVEQVAVARQAVTTAELVVASARTALERDQSLFESGTIPKATLDAVRAEFDLASASRDGAVAQLAVVAAPAQDTEIASLQASIARNEEETEFSRLLLEYTNIRAPVSGQVVGPLTEVPLGAYLATGGLFAELEDNRVVIAEVEVPETTIAEVEVDAPAELRLWSDPETAITGTVRSIAPRAEERDFGWIIRVQVEVPNPDGRLAANMTGFGKVAAAERPVWQAFGRAIQRFFVIELWSWLP